MAQNPVFGETAANRLLKRIHIVDALTNERTLIEQILIDIRDNAGVGIDARLAPKKPCVAGPVGARQSYGDTRLQNTVPFRDYGVLPVSRIGVKPGTV